MRSLRARTFLLLCIALTCFVASAVRSIHSQTPPASAASPAPLAWLLADRAHWPKTVALSQATAFPIVISGETKGSMQVPAQTAVQVVQISAEGVLVQHRGSQKQLAFPATNLLQIAASLARQTPETAAPATAPTATDRATGKATGNLTPTPATTGNKAGNAQDTLIFGNAKSEQAHAFQSQGSAVFQNELTLSGPGTIWDNKDTLIYRQQKLSGDGWIQARVTSTGDISDWAKVGVMFRESLEPASKNAFAFDTGGQGLHSQWRKDTGGGTNQSDRLANPGAPPFWVRAERKGSQFILSASADGKTWSELSTQQIAMEKEIFMGLANSAASVEKMNYAILDNITTSNPPSAAWKDVSIGESTIKGGSMVNGLGETSRRLLPQEPAYYYGGEMTFQMKVDPVKQNYCTAKLWGTDGSGTMGRIILNCEDKEVGMRHGAGLDIFIHNVGAVSPGAFWYRTTILPKWLTAGKTSVTIRLRSVGDLYAYGTPWNYDKYQHKLEHPTRGLYRIYTHTDPMFVPGPEVQGKAPDYATAPVRPELAEADFFKKFKGDANGHLDDLLEKNEPNQGDAAKLAEGYRIAWTSVYKKAAVLPQVVKAIDALCKKYYADPKLAAGEWGGNFGPTGYALALLAPELKATLKASLDQKIDLGGGNKTRREQYTAMLRDSVDAGRFGRQSITNQAIINATNIYRANRGLLALDAREALPEAQARRYFRESCGMEEWRGDDPRDGKNGEPGKLTGIWMMTPKGTSHEWNWCCANCYGRMDPYVYEMYRLSDDPGFRDRAIQIQRAHNFMVYASVDEAGYRSMLNEGVICTRNVYHPGHTYYGYANIIASLADKGLLGTAQQGFADHQFLDSWQIAEASLFFPDDYEKIKNALGKAGPLPPLPATPGQPDFAWADEANAVLSIKHGRDQHFLTFARRSERGLTRIGDAHSITPQYERVVQFALDDVQYRGNGESNTIDDRVQSDFTGTPPDKPVSAYGGQKLPKMQGRAGTPADFYNVRYGDYVIGMNCSTDKKIEFKPTGVLGGIDLISGKKASLPALLPPQSTMVLYAPVK